MSLNLRENQRRHRRQQRLRMAKRLAFLILFGVVGYMAYAAGTDLAERDVTRLEGEVVALSQRLAAADEQAAQSRAEAQEARRQEQEMRQRYDNDVPTGPAKDLLAQIKARLEEGLRPARLQLAIGAAVNEPVCEGEPVTKRFIVRTPLYRGPHTSVGFANNAITVTADGQSGVDADDRAHAWFDPAQPVAVSFVVLSGQNSEISGVLPLHHSVVADGAEYRFSILAGDSRGFVNVTSDRCKAT